LGEKRMQCHFLELEHGWVVLQVNYRSFTATIVLKKSNNMKDNTHYSNPAKNRSSTIEKNTKFKLLHQRICTIQLSK